MTTEGIKNTIATLKSTIKNLKASRAILEDENAWIKNAFAKKSKRCKYSGMFPTEDQATCFCSTGAVLKVKGLDSPSGHCTPNSELHYLSKSMWQDGFDYYGPIENIYETNDCRKTKHTHILMSFDFAILMAQDDLEAAKQRLKMGMQRNE